MYVMRGALVEVIGFELNGAVNKSLDARFVVKQ
jgi:hypothetical protein